MAECKVGVVVEALASVVGVGGGRQPDYGGVGVHGGSVLTVLGRASCSFRSAVLQKYGRRYEDRRSKSLTPTHVRRQR